MSQPVTASNKLITPFNVIAAIILAVGGVIAIKRFFIDGWRRLPT